MVRASVVSRAYSDRARTKSGQVGKSKGIRKLPTQVTPTRWNPATPLVASIEEDRGIESTRLWRVLRRF
jgi:hypothetical protein